MELKPAMNAMNQSIKQSNTKRPSFGSPPTKSFFFHLQTFPSYKISKGHFKEATKLAQHAPFKPK